MASKYDDALPITSLLPETSATPVLIYDPYAALRIAVVERDFAKQLDAEEWDQPGVYILLDLPSPDGTWRAYVGKAPGGIRARILSHLREKGHWRRALLIQRDTTHGFNSAQVAWLEGRLYDLLDSSENAVLHNGNRPSDDTLPPYERTSLEQSVIPIQRVLRLIGYDPSTADDSGLISASAAKARTSKFYGITVASLLHAGLVRVEQNLVSTMPSVQARGTIVADGRIEFEGVVHDSPSSAGAAARGGSSTNGWSFWAIETDNGLVTLATIRARYQDSLS